MGGAAGSHRPPHDGRRAFALTGGRMMGSGHYPGPRCTATWQPSCGILAAPFSRRGIKGYLGERFGITRRSV